MSARIIVTLILEYDDTDVIEFENAMQTAFNGVVAAGEETEAEYETVRVVDVQVSG